MTRIAVLTHRRIHDTSTALELLRRRAREAGVTLCVDDEECEKHGLEASSELERGGDQLTDIALCLVLGGDGTILRALGRYAGTGVPVFAINYGEIGFLATVEPDAIEDGIRRAFAGEFELLHLPAITLDLPGGVSGPGAPPQLPREHRAINDVAIHRRVGERVAELGYSLAGQEAGSVRCDGLVVATPAGSTGYNLANGGPVMAWGVEGFVVSFIAPHSISARALVVAPDDRLTIHNRSREPLDIAVDGRPVAEILPGASIEVGFTRDVGTLAQLSGASFYLRLRQKFGRLAS
ncbi:MAG TPA: NAD(+)/NADH kinase [Solirubrobacteraceae bacterium]|nr:NAD(+)/NADH kinase [Solirubrobacteraceae bacterium]